LHLLGPVEATLEGRRVPLGATKQRALLALLALYANATLSTDRLVDGLWGETPPATAAKMVQLYVSQLRRLLDGSDAAIITHGRGYELRIAEDAVDVAQFERLVRDATRQDAASNGAARDALALWRGPALADVADEPFAPPEIRRLDELWLRASELVIEDDLASGRDEAALAELERLLDEHPLRERLHGLRMRALYLSGRQAEALAAYVEARTRLVEEAGVEPGAELRELHERMLRQDGRLAAARPRDPPRDVVVNAPAAASTAPPRASRPARVATPRRLLFLAAVALLAVTAVLAIRSATRTELLSAIPENAVGVIDPGAHGVVGQYPVGRGPVAIAQGGGSVWVANGEDGTVSRIDREGERIVAIPVGEQPAGLAYGFGSLWVTDSHARSVAQVDPRTNRVVRRFDVANAPRGVAVGFGALWVASEADRTITRIDLATGKPAEPIHLAASPTALAAGAGAVWAISEEGGTVARIEPRTGAVLESIPVGDGPIGAAVGAGAVWVANRQGSTVVRIDPAGNRVTLTVPVDGDPTAIAADDRSVWVASGAESTVTRIDPSTRSPAERTRVESSPSALAVVDGAVWAAALPSAQRHRGGTLRIDLGPPRYQFPKLEAGNYDTNPLLGLSYDGLLSYRRAGGSTLGPLVGDLATGVPEPSADRLAYVFTLRRGIRYSDGTLVQPVDVRASMEDLIGRTKELPPFWKAIIGAPRCRAPGVRRCDLSRGIVTDAAARTVTFRLGEPDPELLHKLATTLTVVAPAAHPFSARTLPPGTGPYRIATYDHRRSAKLVRNPYFKVWSADATPAGTADEILVRFRRDPDDAIGAVQRGEADIAFVRNAFGRGASLDRIKTLATQNRGQLHTSATPELDFAFLNAATPPFDDVRVRRAVNYAADRRRIEQIAGGPDLGQSTCQIVPPGFPGYRARCRYTEHPGPGGAWVAPDLARARRLIARSGTRGMRVTVWGYPEKRELHEYLVRLLRNLGYRSSLRLFPSYPKWSEQVHVTQQKPQIGIDAWAFDFAVPSSFSPPWSCALHTPELEFTGNLARFCDRRIETRMREASAASGPRAIELWQDVYRRLEDAAPIVPLVNRRTVILASDRVGNYQHHPLWGTLYEHLFVR
jgi:peptide/nickel transport system substrate-binding protein